ncbi:MAG: hypothetical protein DRJ42_16635 [Deltaproteobacteria bacterium]|nr:MAG: hypothetical protein DRJ42_16635 [Deltaproteobacteria bacterium]
MNAGGQNRQLPRGVLVGAVLGSGLLTAWAMWQTQAGGPQTSWDRVDTAVAGIWADAEPAGAVQMTAAQMPLNQPAYGPVLPTAGAPMTAAAAMAQTALVARVRGAPPIWSGTNRPHGDRGSCVQCHSVLAQNGRPVPMIRSTSTMPHSFRGICSNCHTVMGDGPVGPTPVAMPVQPGPGALGGAMAGAMVAPPAAQPRVPQPQELEWRGLETRAGPQGVTVNNVDGAARRAGVLPGDVVVSLNGGPVSTMAQLEALTMNGTLPQGTVIVHRQGQRMAFELRQGPGVGVAAPSPMAGGFRPQQSPRAGFQPMAGM